jgi:hypothetical protein
VDGVKFVNGRGRPMFAEMDVADVVVAGDGTFPTIAIARGVPTVMYSQHRPAWGLPGEQQVIPRRLALYEDYNRFPFDAEDGPLDEVVHAAARSEAPIAHWKRRFLGEPFDALAAVRIIETVAAGPLPPTRLDPTRAFTTLGFVDELVERPELLRSYAARFGPQDDASLMLCAPGIGATQLLELAEAAVAAAGLDESRLPDILLTPVAGSREAYQALAERADAVLSQWPAVGPIGTLPRFDAAAVS